MNRGIASLLLLWAVFGGPLCAEICAQTVTELPPCHAPEPAEEAPAHDDERCCDEPDAFASMSSAGAELGATLLAAPAFSFRIADAHVTRVLAHPPDPAARPFARTHRPLLT